MGGKLRLTTDALAPRERFAFWREMALVQLGVATQWDERSADKPFGASSTLETKGPLRRIRGASDMNASRRGAEQIANRPSNCLLIYRESRSKDISLFQSGRESFELGGGELVAVDFDEPTALFQRDGFDYDLLLVPKALVRPHIRKRDEPFTLRLSQAQGLGALAASLLDSVYREWDQIPDSAMGTVANMLGQLIGVASGAAAGEHAEAVDAGRISEAERFIEANLAKPSLSAANASAALKISERTLYMLYARQGTSFAARVRQRRLEECRAALIANPRRPVIDIALAWGFGSLPSFYRAFQAAFGLSPTDFREATRAGLVVRETKPCETRSLGRRDVERAVAE